MSNSERRSRSDISKASTSIENYNKRIRMLKKSKDETISRINYQLNYLERLHKSLNKMNNRNDITNIMSDILKTKKIINKLEKNSKRDTQRMNNLETQKRNVLDIKIKKRVKK